MRTCIKCGEEKELELFIKRSDRPLGRGTVCKKCQSKRVRKHQLDNPDKYGYTPASTIKRHGLTIDEYDEMYGRWAGLCWVCKTNEIGAIDHDHNCCPGAYSCGKCVRGLLCGQCNRVLGLVKDNVITLENMINYLGR